MATEKRRDQRRGADYERAGEGYMQQRELRSGAAGWVLLAGLGVAYVISGDFAGWNFGLAEGGWGGLLVATVLMATMYTCLVFCLAELSSAIPVTGGGYGFARRALGPLGGMATGTAILIEYAIAPAAIVVFIGGYIESLDLFGISSGWPVYLVFYAIFVGVHLFGVGEALKVMFVITVIAVVALLAFVIGMIPKFDASNLTNIKPTDAWGASDFLPFGIAGILSAFVYGIWFFLAIEGVPLAAEETRGKGSFVGEFVNYVGLAGLIASFFSIIFAYSRQLFALSRAGYLPRRLSVTNARKTPHVALVVPGLVGFLLAAITEDGATLINIAVFGATVSYVLMLTSHIVLRRSEPGLERPYTTPGGLTTACIGWVLAVGAVIATFLVDEKAAGITAAIFLALLAYFWFYSRHHLVAEAPEEEFAAIERAESELTG